MPGPRRVVGVIRSSAHAHGVGAHLRSSVSACGHGGSSAGVGKRKTREKKRFWRRWAARDGECTPFPPRRRGSTPGHPPRGNCRFFGVSKEVRGQRLGVKGDAFWWYFLPFSLFVALSPPLPFLSLPSPPLPFRPIPAVAGSAERKSSSLLHRPNTDNDDDRARSRQRQSHKQRRRQRNNHRPTANTKHRHDEL